MFGASTLAINLTLAPFLLNLYFYIVFGASTLAIHVTFAPVMQNLYFYIGFWAVPPAILVTFAPLMINSWFYNVFSLSGLALPPINSWEAQRIWQKISENNQKP